MTAVVDRVLERWRASGSVDHAVAALTGVATAAESGGVHRPRLAKAVAREIAPAHAKEHDVQLATGRMLLAHRELDLAKRHLLLAAKLAPGTPSAPHLLGEALLLQGDAERAARALNAALRAGSDDEACRNWYRAALAYIPFQHRDGFEAVAKKVRAGMGGGPAEVEEEQPPEADDRMDSEPPTQVARIAALPQMPSMPAPQATSMFPTDLEPAEEVPHDEATAIVSMDELREMIEEDLREAEDRGLDDDDDDDFLEQTAVRHIDDEDATANTVVVPPKLPPERPRRAAARPLPAIPAPTRTAAEPAMARAKKEAPAPLEPAARPRPDPASPPPSPARTPSKESAPVVEMPRPVNKPVSLESAPVVEAPARPPGSDAPAGTSAEAPDAPASSPKKKRGNTALVLTLLLVLIGVLLFGIRTGRLPALAKHLPPWVTGEAPLPFP